jgi:hypothetical protein
MAMTEIVSPATAAVDTSAASSGPRVTGRVERSFVGELP